MQHTCRFEEVPVCVECILADGSPQDGMKLLKINRVTIPIVGLGIYSFRNNSFNAVILSEGKDKGRLARITPHSLVKFNQTFPSGS
jgi:hypothetical protein